MKNPLLDLLDTNVNKFKISCNEIESKFNDLIPEEKKAFSKLKNYSETHRFNPADCNKFLEQMNLGKNRHAQDRSLLEALQKFRNICTDYYTKTEELYLAFQKAMGASNSQQQHNPEPRPPHPKPENNSQDVLLVELEENVNKWGKVSASILGHYSLLTQNEKIAFEQLHTYWEKSNFNPLICRNMLDLLATGKNKHPTQPELQEALLIFRRLCVDYYTKNLIYFDAFKRTLKSKNFPKPKPKPKPDPSPIPKPKPAPLPKIKDIPKDEAPNYNIAEAEFSNNMIEYANKNYYLGEYSDRMPNGKGKYIFASGSTITGTFSNGELHGFGKHSRFEFNYIAEGSYQLGQLIGKAKLTWNLDQKFIGDMTDNRNGVGILYLKNGKIERGYFTDGSWTRQSENVNFKKNPGAWLWKNLTYLTFIPFIILCMGLAIGVANSDQPSLSIISGIIVITIFCTFVALALYLLRFTLNKVFNLYRFYLSEINFNYFKKTKENKENSKPENKHIDYPNADYYIGEWNYGEPNGKGKHYYANGDWKEGTFVDGELHGQGASYFSAHQRTDTGKYAHGMRIGKGYMIWKDGTKYTGAWNNSGINGKGEYTFCNGSYKKGTFMNGELHGRGKYYDAINECTKSGYFQHGELKGKAKIIWKNGQKFVGEMTDSSNGEGFLYFPDKSYQRGYLQNGQWIPSSEKFNPNKIIYLPWMAYIAYLIYSLFTDKFSIFIVSLFAGAIIAKLISLIIKKTSTHVRNIYNWYKSLTVLKRIGTSLLFIFMFLGCLFISLILVVVSSHPKDEKAHKKIATEETLPNTHINNTEQISTRTKVEKGEKKPSTSTFFDSSNDEKLTNTKQPSTKRERSNSSSSISNPFESSKASSESETK